LSYSGNLLVENRNGLIVNAELLEAHGRAERDAALVMLEQIPDNGRITVGGDKGFDTQEFVKECRRMNVTPMCAERRQTGRQRHRCAHHASRWLSRESEETQTDQGVLRLTERHRTAVQTETSRHPQSGLIFTFAAAAYNLARLRKLVPIQCGLMGPECLRGRRERSAERTHTAPEWSEHPKTGENKRIAGRYMFFQHTAKM
jgi:hypothetical protein